MKVIFLIEPKIQLLNNIKNYFVFEGVVLEFQDSALQEIVKIAIKKRQEQELFRSVMEEHLMDIMYQLPEMEGIERVIITKDTIVKGNDPL